MIYTNGVKVAKPALRRLETISSAQQFYREFINSGYLVFFCEKYCRRQVKKGLSREQMLKKIRDSNRYETLQNVYEYRVLCDGQGDIKRRLISFKNVFRVKFNNQWNQRST